MTKPRVKATLWEMAAAAGGEASRIRASQRALVRCGMRDKPSDDQIRKAEVFEDLERLIYTIMPVQDEVRKVLAPIARAMATKDKFDREAEAAPIEPPTENSDID